MHDRITKPRAFTWMSLLTAALVAAVLAWTPRARAEAPSAAIVATLTAARASFGAADEVVVRLTLSNPSDATIGVLRWMTPADGIAGPLFTITRDGVAVPYLGKLVKRAAPTAADYVEVAAGASVAWDVTLSEAYDFAVSGDYAVTFDVTASQLYGNAADGAVATPRLVSGTITIAVAGRPRPGAALPRSARAFVGCSSGDQVAVTNARNAAIDYATYASDYLDAAIVDGHYTLWFGAYDGGRYATVANHFGNIQSLLAGNGASFDCSGTDCSDTWYAFVSPSDPTFTIHLCDVFWQIPTAGIDSRAGTLIHESSHFTTIAGTSDYAYGQSDAQLLALGNPSQAIMNADSHEYFAETSTPVAPVATPTVSATPNGHGFVPPDPDSAKCETTIAKNAGKLAACAATCQIKRAGAMLKGKAFDEDACEDGPDKSCRSAYDGAGAKLAPGLCPPCLDTTAQGTVADGVLSFIDGSNGASYCAGTVAFGGDDTGFVPPDKDTASCESGAAKNLQKLAGCVAKCQAKQVGAAIKGKAFDVEACKRAPAKSCRAAHDAASAKLLAKGLCPSCLDAGAQASAADAVMAAVEGRNAALYCAGSTPLP